MPECLLLGQITGDGNYWVLKLLKILKVHSWAKFKSFHKITESNVRQLGAEALAGKSQRACFAATDKSEGGWEKYDTDLTMMYIVLTAEKIIES